MKTWIDVQEVFPPWHFLMDRDNNLLNETDSKKHMNGFYYSKPQLKWINKTNPKRYTKRPMMRGQLDMIKKLGLEM